MDGNHGAFGTGHAADGRINDRAALVQNHIKGDSLLQKPVPGRRNSVAEGFFVAGRTEPHIAFGLEATTQKLLQRR